MKIFISYKREEQAIAESVRQHLEGLGYQTWMDVHSIPSGVSWADAIEQGLRESDVVLGLMSERSIASPNVKNEWDYALVYGEKFNTRLILAKLDECVVPLNYVRLNWVDWRNGADFSRLKTALDNPTPSPAASIPPAEKAYLEWLYHRINTVLAAKIIFSDPANPDPIALVTERTRGAVDALFEKMPELDPLFAAMGLDNPDDSADYSSFGAAFEALDQRVLLLGEPGAGKTITLLHMARDAVVRRTQDRHAPLPLYAIIPFWDAYQHAEWLPWLQSQSLNKLPTLIDDYTQGRLLLVLDGLDELGREKPIDPTKEDGPTFDPRLRFMEQLPANNAVVVSCRIKDYHDIGQAIKLRGAITLQKLSTAQIEGFLAKMPPLLTAIQSDDRLRELVETPLLLSLFAVGYRDSSEEELRALADLAHSPGDLRDKIFQTYVKERYEHEARKFKLRGEKLPFDRGLVYEDLGLAASLSLGRDSKSDKALLITHEVEPSEGEFDLERPWWSNYAVPSHLRRDMAEFAVRLDLLTPQTGLAVVSFVHLRLRDYFAFQWIMPDLHYYESDVACRLSCSVARRLGDSRAVPALVRVLMQPREQAALGKAVMHAIKGHFGLAPTPATVVSSALSDCCDLPLTPDLHRLLQSEALEHQMAAHYILANNPASSAVMDETDILHGFTRALEHTDWRVRQVGAYAIGRRGDKVWNHDATHQPLFDTSIPALIAATHDAEPQVVEVAYWAMSKLPDPRILEPILTAWHQGNLSAQARAAVVAGLKPFTADARVLDVLIAALKTKKENDDPLAKRDFTEDMRVRNALFALEGISDARLMEALPALIGPQYYSRTATRLLAVQEAWADLDYAATSALLSSLRQGWEGEVVLELLQHWTATSLRAAIFLWYANPIHATIGSDFAHYCTGPRLTHTLMSVLDELPDPYPSRVVDVLLPLKARSGANNENIGAWTASMLLAFLKSGSLTQRLVAARVLGTWRVAQAIPYLAEMTHDDSPLPPPFSNKVSHFAQAALLSIGTPEALAHTNRTPSPPPAPSGSFKPRLTRSDIQRLLDKGKPDKADPDNK